MITISSFGSYVFLIRLDCIYIYAVVTSADRIVD